MTGSREANEAREIGKGDEAHTFDLVASNFLIHPIGEQYIDIYHGLKTHRLFDLRNQRGSTEENIASSASDKNAAVHAHRPILMEQSGLQVTIPANFQVFWQWW